MKIGEILEQTYINNIATISKGIEGTNEKALRGILKSIGCEPNKGVKGWTYSGSEPETLDKSIYDFIQPKETNKPISQQVNKTTKKEIVLIEKKPTNNKLKKVTYEIEEALHDEIKILSIQQKRNVSEIVNEFIKNQLK